MRVTISVKEIESTNKIIKNYFDFLGIELTESILLAIWSDEKRLNKILNDGGILNG